MIDCEKLGTISRVRKKAGNFLARKTTYLINTKIHKCDNKEENLESRKELGNAIVLTELRDMLNMILNTNHSNRSKGTLSPIDDEWNGK